MNETIIDEIITPIDMAMEIIGWSIIYTIFIMNLLVPYVRKSLSSKPFWLEMSKRPGQALTSMAEESVLCLSVSLHHIFGGSLMLYGQLMNNTNVWLHGLFVEIGFEVVDISCLLMNSWPYTIVQPNLRLLTIFHHIPGLFAAPCLVLSGYHKDGNLQTIGWSLLLAGGISLLCDGIKQTRSLQTQLGQWLSLHVINMFSVLFARFIIYPYAAYGLLETCWKSNAPQYLYILCLIGTFSMAFFNSVVVVLMTEKLLRYGKVYVFGKRQNVTKSE